MSANTPPAQPPLQSPQQQQDLATLVQLLAGLTMPDTETIRHAELQLKPVLKLASTMDLLFAVIADTQQNPAVRHVAAIVLRKRLPTHYAAFTAAQKLQWQHNVMACLGRETVRTIRGGWVGIVAAIAHTEQQAFPALLQFLEMTANGADRDARELCFWLLSEMTETVGTYWMDHAAALYRLFHGCLTNAQESPAVHKMAAQALGGLMSFWTDEVAILDGFVPLLPILLQVASQQLVAAAAGAGAAGQQQQQHVHVDEDFLVTVLDVLYDLAYSPSQLLGEQNYLNTTVSFALQCVASADLELRVRDAAALVIATTAEAKPKSLGKQHHLVQQILDVLFQLMQDSPASAAGALFESNPAWRQDLIDERHAAQQAQHGGASSAADDHSQDTDDFDNPTTTSMAQGTLDMLACEIPKKYIWEPALSRCLVRMTAQDSPPAARKAGVAGLGVIAEGCCEPLAVALPEILPHVLALARDASHPQVRECACFCLGQISEHCQPDILQYSEAILPTVFQLLDDHSVAVQVTSCYVLEMFCERLEPAAVRPLLDAMVRKLASMLESTTKRSVQEMAVAALAATAVAAEEEFTPYIAGVASLMVKLMSLQDHNLFTLRGRALECMGHMAIAVGRDHFRPYFPTTMQCALEGLTKDSTELQEFAYAAFANLAKVMKDEFAPALPDLVPHLVQVIEQDEGQLEPAGGGDDAANGDAAGGGGGGGFAALDDSDDEGEGGAGMVLHVRTALVEVKKGAITALGEMAAHTGTAYCPYLEQSMQVLQKAATNWHPLVKSETAAAFPSMIVPSIAAYHNGEITWTKGKEIAENPALSQHTSALVTAVLQEEVTIMKDDDKISVEKACEACQSVIELCGPHALVPVAGELLQATLNLLMKAAPCQTIDALYGEVPDDDDDHDEVMQAACDLVGGFCRVMGNHFGPHLPHFLPAICEYGKSSRPTADRSMAVGCLSEIAQELDGAVIAEHWPTVFLPAVLAGLADPDDNVKRNAAFCTGMCCDDLREGIAGDYPAILQQLGPIFGLQHNNNEASMAAIDNAAAALARMIMACPNAVPLDQVLPVFLQALPLKTDMSENETVYNCLIGLLNHPEILKHKAEVQRVLTAACSGGNPAADGSTPSTPAIDEELVGRLRQALQTVSGAQ